MKTAEQSGFLHSLIIALAQLQLFAADIDFLRHRAIVYQLSCQLHTFIQLHTAANGQCKHCGETAAGSCQCCLAVSFQPLHKLVGNRQFFSHASRDCRDQDCHCQKRKHHQGRAA